MASTKRTFSTWRASRTPTGSPGVAGITSASGFGYPEPSASEEGRWVFGVCVCLGGPAHKSVCFLHADACPTHPDLPASVCQHACISVVPFPRMLGVLRALQRASGASSGKRETTSAPPWAAPRNARWRDAEARGPSRARVPAPTCVWVDSQAGPFEGRGKTKRTSDSIDEIESNPERPEILDESPSSAQAPSTTHKPFSN